MTHATADIVVGLGWGDEGKGATIDALAAHRRPDLVVRFNGGHQAAHNVTAAGVHHTFATFGSATLSGVPTWISRYCTVEPLAAAHEAAALRATGFAPEAYVDASCLLTTPLHALANRAREQARGAARHGSTGMGFGETIAYGLAAPEAAPRAADLARPEDLTAKLDVLRAHYVAEGVLSEGDVPLDDLPALAAAQARAAAGVFALVDDDRLHTEISRSHTLFEGAQGFWLDENFGFQPHTTWSTTTPANARALLREAGVTDVRTIGCLRTYATRHGAGPLPGEGMLPGAAPEPHNDSGSFAGAFRTGAHDPRLVRAAIDLALPDVLAVSHLDVFDRFVTTDGMLPVSSFGPVLVAAHGPRRGDRVVHEGRTLPRAA
jgi:adenylosuccinate synthase